MRTHGKIADFARWNKGETEKEEYRYYISSPGEDIELFSRAVREHWAVMSAAHVIF